MIDDNFSFETVGAALAAGLRWRGPNAGGAGSGSFVFQADGADVVVGGGTGICTRADETPETVHPAKGDFGARTRRALNQRAEVRLKWDAAPGATNGQAGCLVRATGDTAWVALWVNFNAAFGPAAELVESVGGVPAVLKSLPLPNGTAGALSLRLEVLGRRARVWVERGAAGVADRPPDDAADLAGAQDPELPGNWGIYGAGAGWRFTRFAAALLPTAVMPPPMLAVADATASGYNFAPVRLTAAGLGDAAGDRVEWEVLPAESADRPEPYRDQTDRSVNPHVVWVRKGYAYRARARLLGPAAGAGPWTEYAAVPATGAASAAADWTNKTWQQLDWPAELYGPDPSTGGPARAEVDFPDVNPDYVLEGDDAASPIVTVSNSGHERVTSPEARPRRSFKLGFKDRVASQYQRLIDFFEFMQARDRAFNWAHPATGERFVLRFAADDYEVVYRDQGVGGPVVELALPATESPLYVTGTIPITLRVDPALLA